MTYSRSVCKHWNAYALTHIYTQKLCLSMGLEILKSNLFLSFQYYLNILNYIKFITRKRNIKLVCKYTWYYLWFSKWCRESSWINIWINKWINIDKLRIKANFKKMTLLSLLFDEYFGPFRNHRESLLLGLPSQPWLGQGTAACCYPVMVLSPIILIV